MQRRRRRVEPPIAHEHVVVGKYKNGRGACRDAGIQRERAALRASNRYRSGTGNVVDALFHDRARVVGRIVVDDDDLPSRNDDCNCASRSSVFPSSVARLYVGITTETRCRTLRFVFAKDLRTDQAEWQQS